MGDPMGALYTCLSTSLLPFPTEAGNAALCSLIYILKYPPSNTNVF